MPVRLGGAGLNASDLYLMPGDWRFTSGLRYQRATKLFRETQEARDLPSGRRTQTILELGGQYAINRQETVAVQVPIVDFNFGFGRAASPEHLDSTSATGLGDITLFYRRWVNPVPYFRDSSPSWRKNLSFGLGVKLPTGNSNAKDEYTNGAGVNRRPRAVDISSQPGDGGLGFVLELQGFQAVGQSTLFVAAAYLVNPREMNDTLSLRANLRGPANTPRDARFNSVPDQYYATAGISRAVRQVRGLTASLAGKVTGTPPRDLIGGSDGYRFAGHAVSVDPGLTYTRGNDSWSVSIPVTVYRFAADVEAVPLRDWTTFAPFQLNVTYSHRFGQTNRATSSRRRDP